MIIILHKATSDERIAINFDHVISFREVILSGDSCTSILLSYGTEIVRESIGEIMDMLSDFKAT